MKYLIPVLIALVCFAAPAQACDQVFAVQAYAVQPVYQVFQPVYAVQAVQVAVPVYAVQQQVVVQKVVQQKVVQQVVRPQVIRQRSFSFSRTVIR